MKPYRTIPIKECGEPMAPIPRDRFAFFEPHPYLSVGAPYGNASPWMLRQGVLKALDNAASQLALERPGWKIKLFDAYRPNAVQAFMVDRAFASQAQVAGLDPAHLTASEREDLHKKVFRLWGIPSDDPATPPPHSTGGAVDCTLTDENENEVSMGSPIDENSERSFPDFFATSSDASSRQAHANRVFLNDLMRAQGFQRVTTEWWHFSLGDQLWAWREREERRVIDIVARYGRV